MQEGVLSTTVGGCAMNTTRAANFYFQAHPRGPYHQRVMTIGSIGSDTTGKFIQDQLKTENVLADMFVVDGAITGQCAVTVV